MDKMTELKDKLAEAIRAGEYEDATRIALDVIDHLEQINAKQEGIIQQLQIRTMFARRYEGGRNGDYDPTIGVRMLQEGETQ